jgi:hypothetical protein
MPVGPLGESPPDFSGYCSAVIGAINQVRWRTRPDEEITMSFFGKILEKLGFGKAEAAPAPAPRTPAPPPAATPAPMPAPAAPPLPKPVAVVDVVAQLEKLAAANPQKLNWKVSIVDLLKLLDIDSSFAARKALATELGCPADLMGDSAKMNMWLHKTVLKKIADNGGNVPKELLD